MWARSETSWIPAVHSETIWSFFDGFFGGAGASAGTGACSFALIKTSANVPLAPRARSVSDGGAAPVAHAPGSDRKGWGSDRLEDRGDPLPRADAHGRQAQAGLAV